MLRVADSRHPIKGFFVAAFAVADEYAAAAAFAAAAAAAAFAAAAAAALAAVAAAAVALYKLLVEGCFAFWLGLFLPLYRL